MGVTDHPSGREALQYLDRAMAARPGRDGPSLSHAVRGLATFRDHVIAAHKTTGGHRYRPTLDRVNAVISVVLAAEFPIGEVPWEEVEKARSWLVAIVGDPVPQ